MFYNACYFIAAFIVAVFDFFVSIRFFKYQLLLVIDYFMCSFIVLFYQLLYTVFCISHIGACVSEERQDETEIWRWI